MLIGFKLAWPVLSCSIDQMFVYNMLDDASSTRVSPNQVIWLDKRGSMSVDIQYNDFL